MEKNNWISGYTDELEELRLESFSLFADYMFEKELQQGLTHVQVVLLKYLLKNHRSTVSETSEYLGVTMAAVSSLVDRMVRCQLIHRERSEDDRRVVYIRLSSQGRKTIENYLKRYRRRMEHLIRTMGKENTELFLKSLKNLRDTLETILKEKDEQEKWHGTENSNCRDD